LLDAVGSGHRVLDVGCSAGYVAQALVDRNNSVVGLEFDPAAAQVARGWCEDVIVGDVEIVPFDLPPDSFDVVLCADVIEHLRDPAGLLRRVRSLLRTDGRLVVSTPNIANWTIRLGLLFGRFRYTDRGILDRTHTHLFTRKTLLECVASAGFTTDTVDITVPVPVVGTPRIEAAAHTVGSCWPTLAAYQFVLTAWKSEEGNNR
jgi:2-polyprenyl-3-methyl-5-hydroxy-6-metoxy-1,4-benzoquinol methylase